MEKFRLGNSDHFVSSMGLGCMGMSEHYGPTNDQESIYIIHKALEKGINFFDTADVYGSGHNEKLLGQALKEKRDKVVIATKFGFLKHEAGLKADPKYVPRACDASLKRLGVETIDLYYLHRVDPNVPVEDTVGAMARLIEAGKIRALGLSEVSCETIQRAHATYPISALQSEYSVWVRDVEPEILSLCEALQISFISYCPLGRGFLTGKLRYQEFDKRDYRYDIPLFAPENFENNLTIVKTLENIAKIQNCTPAQVALAWIKSQHGNIIPIPGTKRLKYLIENIQSLYIKLTEQQLQQIHETSLIVKGQRKNKKGMDMIDF